MRLNLSIREYFRKPDEASQSSAWLAQQEIPTAEEINNESAVEISVNQIKGSWECKDKYLQAHYELFRDDAVAPIRDAVMEVKETPEMMEKDSKEHAGIYENVCGLGFPVGHCSLCVGIHHRHDIRTARNRSKNYVFLTTSREEDPVGAVETTNKRKHCRPNPCR